MIRWTQNRFMQALLYDARCIVIGGRFASSTKDKKIDAVLKLFKERGLVDLKEAKSYDAFKLFAIEQRYNINSSELKREMFKLQRMLHPDRYVTEDRDSQSKSDLLSSLVNELYEILSHPYNRAKYLLAIITHKNLSEVEKSLDNLQMDPSFLDRMMGIRERIENGQSDMRDMYKLKSEVDSELESLVADLDNDFRHKDVATITKKLGKLKFLANCQKALESRLGDL